MCVSIVLVRCFTFSSSYSYSFAKPAF